MPSGLSPEARHLRSLIVSGLIVAGFGAAVYAIFGHDLIRRMYDGTAPAALAGVIRSQSKLPLTYYFDLGDKAAVVLGALLTGVIIAVGLLVRYGREAVRVLGQELRGSVFRAGANALIAELTKGRVIVAVLLLAGFFGFYHFEGVRLERAHALERDNQLFEADVQCVVEAMTLYPQRMTPYIDEHHSARHPLFEMLVNPAGALLVRTGIPRVSAALLLSNFSGALAVALIFLVAALALNSRLAALCFALIYGAAMGPLVFGAMPETYALASCSLAFVCLLMLVDLRRGRVSLPLWIIAGVLTLGMNTVNVVQTLICFVAVAVFAEGRPSLRRIVPQALGFIAAVAAVSMALALVQWAIYPLSPPFFLPGGGSRMLEFFDLRLLREPLTVLPNVLYQLGAVSLIGPHFRTLLHPELGQRVITFDGAYRFGIWGWCALALWVPLLLWSLYRLRQGAAAGRVWGLALAGCVLFSVAFHAFFGWHYSGRAELFLYACNVAPLLLLLVTRAAPWRSLPERIYLTIFLVALALNNLREMDALIKFYS